MYLVTNRAISKGSSLKVFGKKPNPNGPNELRLVKVDKKNNKWQVEHIEDKLSQAEVTQLKSEFELDIDENKQWHSSLAVACQLFKQAKEEQKAILFFVHGYNNDVGDVLKAAYEIESLYNVIVVPFTWPANGGGVISGTASYLSDKSDARASSGAFNRFVEKIHLFHGLLTRGALAKIEKDVEEKYPDKINPSAAANLHSRLVKDSCKVKINLLCHSMGNYLLKHSLMTGENATSNLVFDNICLVAADTNNKKHALWVEQLDVRKRIYIVINEDDSALKASRVKPGKEQLARLGHYLKKLNSDNAHYIDLTDVAHIDSEHTYFKGDSVAKNSALKMLFRNMFTGLTVEKHLKYHSDNNSYRIPQNS